MYKDKSLSEGSKRFSISSRALCQSTNSLRPLETFRQRVASALHPLWTTISISFSEGIHSQIAGGFQGNRASWQHADFLKNGAMVPIYGNVAAGEPLHIPSVTSRHEDAFEFVHVPTAMLNGHTEPYALKVKGDSMIDALITDGDCVILDRTSEPNPGDMVVAEIMSEESVTLKRFFREGSKIRLQPENPTMEAIVVDATDISVKGRVIGLLRSF